MTTRTWVPDAKPCSIPDERRCIGTVRRTGRRCGRAAYPGATVCSKHGGSAPQVKSAADRRRTRSELLQQAQSELDAAHVSDMGPEEHMLSCLDNAALKHKLYDLVIERLESDNGGLTGLDGDPTLVSDRHGTQQMHALYTERDAWADRHMKCATDCQKAGISERQVQLREAQAHQVGEMFRAALGDPEWGLPLDLQRKGLPIFAKHAKLLKAGS